MPKEAAGFRSINSAIKAPLHEEFKQHCVNTGFSVNQMLKKLILEELNLLDWRFHNWPVEEQRAYLRGK